MTAHRANALYGNASGASITGAYPTGTVIGDVVLCAFYKESDEAITTITPADFRELSAPGGWDCNVAGANFRLHAYIRKFVTGDAAPNFAWATSVWRDAVWVSYSGSEVGADEVTDGDSNADIAVATGTACTHPTIWTGQDATFSILTPANFSAATYGTPAGYTVRQAGARDVGLFDKAMTAPGATGAATSTLSVSAAWIGGAHTIRAAPRGGMRYARSTNRVRRY